MYTPVPVRVRVRVCSCACICGRVCTCMCLCVLVHGYICMLSTCVHTTAFVHACVRVNPRRQSAEPGLSGNRKSGPRVRERLRAPARERMGIHTGANASQLWDLHRLPKLHVCHFQLT